MNKAMLIGRLVADPELRYTGGGTAVCNFRIAVDRDFKNSQGEREADFLDIVTWKKLAELVAQHLNKGRLVAVEGRIQINRWEHDGVKRSRPEIHADRVQFLDYAQDDAGGSEQPPIGDDDIPI